MNQSSILNLLATLYEFIEENELVGDEYDFVEALGAQVIDRFGLDLSPVKTKTKVKKEKKVSTDTLVETTEEPPKKKDTKKKTPSLAEVVESLPKGESFLLDFPYNQLALIDNLQRVTNYLAGVKIQDIVSAQSLAEAQEVGVDKSFVKAVFKSESVEAIKGKSIDISGGKIKIFLDRANNKYDWFSDLFQLITQNGVTKQAILDLQTIVKAQ